MKRYIPVFVCSLLLLLSGCATEYQQRTTAQGAMAGAAVGAVIGAQNDQPVQGAVIGGVLGGMAGAMIGADRNQRVPPAERRYRRTGYQHNAHRNDDRKRQYDDREHRKSDGHANRYRHYNEDD